MYLQPQQYIINANQQTQANQKIKIIRVYQRKLFVKNLKIVNKTPHTIEQLAIQQFRTQIDRWQTNLALINNLLPNQYVQTQWNFGKQPFNGQNHNAFVAFLGYISEKYIEPNMLANYRRDCWILTLKTSNSSQILNTKYELTWRGNVWYESEHWWKNVSQEDNQLVLSIKYNQQSRNYEATIDTNNKKDEQPRIFRKLNNMKLVSRYNNQQLFKQFKYERQPKKWYSKFFP